MVEKGAASLFKVGEQNGGEIGKKFSGQNCEHIFIFSIHSNVFKSHKVFLKTTFTLMVDAVLLKIC